ncbi:MAG: prephenate dehydrogenase [Elusimicrobiota bacterium]
MRKVAIIGVGLMGGSLGLALRRKTWRVVGVGRNPARLKKAKSLGIVQEISGDLRRGVEDASVVVLCAPVDRIAPLARIIRPHLRRDCLVMDVGSVKAAIVRDLEDAFGDPRGPQFVGVHPMAGSEKSGAENARADLYRGAACVVTPGRRTAAWAVKAAENFWRAAGGRVVRMAPEEHDRWAALVSHLPHLLADALVLSAMEGKKADRMVPLLAAGSFRDATRVAQADPEQWAAIFRMNAGPLAKSAERFRRALDGLLRGRGRSGGLRRAALWRRKFIK